MSSTLRIGIVGSGFLARTRARCWKRVHGVNAELVAVASRTEASARKFAAEHGVGRAVSTEALLTADDVDLVDLCVPNVAHEPLTVSAARAGKSVLCTKPLAAFVGQGMEGAEPGAVAAHDRRGMYAVAVAEARSMVAATRECGVQLHYGENWIYAPGFVRAAELTARAAGPLLEMRGWEAHSGSHSPYSKEWSHTGGGALLRLGAHPIGAMLWLKREEGLRMRGEPVRAVAVTGEVADLTQHAALNEGNTSIATGWRGVESWGCVVIAFDDGSRGVAYGSDVSLGGMQSQMQLLGSDHHLECKLSPHDLLSAYAPRDGTFGDAYIMEKVDSQAGWSTPLPDEDWSSGQQGLVQAVAEAAVRGEGSAADGELGLEVTRVVYGSYVSAAEGRRVVLSELGG